MMGHTQGVNNATSPPKKPARKMYSHECDSVLPVSPKFCNRSTTGSQ